MIKRVYTIYVLFILLIPCGLVAQWSSMNTGINKNYSVRSISFPTHEIGYLTCAKNPDENIYFFYKTIDAGLNWQLVDSNIENTNNYEGKIIFVDEQRGFLAGGLYSTEDGGVTWSATMSTENSTVFFSDGSDIFSMDRSESNPTEGLMLKSTDFGRTWKTLSQVNGALTHFEVIDENVFYGFSSRDIEISTDRGSNWDLLVVSTLSEGFGVAISDFKTAENGIVVFTYHGASQVTFDSGQSWNQTNYPGVIRDVEHDSTGFYAVGYQINSTGGIFYSPNGTIWIDCNAGSNEQLNDLLLLENNVAWAVGDYGTVLKNKNLLSSTTQELSGRDKINIFPNPASDSVNIENKSSEVIKKIQLFTAEGKQIYDCLYLITQLDVSTLEVGIYFLRIELENGQQNIQKLVVN